MDNTLILLILGGITVVFLFLLVLYTVMMFSSALLRRLEKETESISDNYENHLKPHRKRHKLMSGSGVSDNHQNTSVPVQLIIAAAVSYYYSIKED